MLDILPLARLIMRLALRNRVRALITTLGVGVTLLAFLMLKTLVSSWYTVNEEIGKSDQLEVRHKISISFVLWRRMAETIRAIPGVEEASAMLWFSGYYKDEKTRFGQLAVEPEYFEIFPEYAPPPEQMEAYLEDLSGAIVGEELVREYGWKIGDRVTITGTTYPGDWDLTVRGIYHGEAANSDRARLFLHYKHVAPKNEHSHRLMVKGDPTVAKKIDAAFANTDTPTKTESVLSVERSWASWSSAVISAIDIGALLILLILVLVLGNAMAMATRESLREYATLRAIGYRSRHILLLVLAEGLFVATCGIALGLAVAPATLRAFSKVMADQLGGTWQLHLDGDGVVLAVGTALAASAVACSIPAWRSSRLRVVEALREVA
jgi:putative ABC transport system permease protein